MREGVEDVVFCYLRFPSGRVAHMHLSWLDPHKERRFTVVGAKRMATFDDMALERKVTIYDKGFDQDFRNYGEYITRSGDMISPQISNEEPLRIECRALRRVRAHGHRAALGGRVRRCARCACSRRCSARSTRAASRRAAGCRAGCLKLCVHPSDLAPGLMLGHDVSSARTLELGRLGRRCTAAR